jgi:hypothetical protein
MKCKDCGKEITGDEYRKVADWMFCLECFGQLMEKSEKKPETEAADPAESVAADTIPLDPAKLVCQSCSKEIDSGQEKKLGIWKFCSQCHGNLIFRPPKPVPPKEPEEEETADAAKDAIGPDGMPVGRVKVEMIKKVNCHGCDRSILEKAGREVDGNLFCPECFYALPDQIVVDVKTKLGHPDSAPDKTAAKDFPATAGRQTEKKCESCEREIIEGNFDTVEGFVICRACLSTDPDMAVEVARGRHQKYLQQLKTDYDT